MIQRLKTAVIKKAVEKADEQFIAFHFPGGIVSVPDLEKMVDTLKDFPDGKVKLTGSLIVGIKDPVRRESFRRRIDLPLASVVRFCVRPVQICSGGYICPNNQQDIYSLGLKLDKLYCGMELPFKMIISVAGCGRCCSEPKVRDIGIIAQKNGFSIYVGGAAGVKPLVGQFFAGSLDEGAIIDIVGTIISTYRNYGKIARRLGQLIEDIGFVAFKDSVLPDKV